MTLSQKELDELQNAITPKDDLYWKGVLYAEFGMRKTTTALRCSQKRAILIHADRGWNVVHNHPEEFGDNVIPIEYEGLSQIRAIVKAVAANQAPFNDVDLIILDTVSQIQEKYLDFLLENAEYKGNFRETLVPKTGIRNFEKTEITGMPDYHVTRNKMRPVIRELITAKVNVMFLAHVREPGPIEVAAGKIEKRPNVTEAVYKLISRDATFIGLIKKGKVKGEYIVDFEPKNTQSAKSQIAALTDKQVNVNELPTILHTWQNN